MFTFSPKIFYVLTLLTFIYWGRGNGEDVGCFSPQNKCPDGGRNIMTDTLVCSPKCTNSGLCKEKAGNTFNLTATYKLTKNLISIPFLAYAYPHAHEDYKFLVAHGDFCKIEHTGNPSTNITCPATADTHNLFSFSYTIPSLAGFRPGNYTLVMDAQTIYQEPNGKYSEPTCLVRVEHNICVNCLL